MRGRKWYRTQGSAGPNRRGYHGVGTGWGTLLVSEKAWGLDLKAGQIPYRLKGPAEMAVALAVELLVKYVGPRAGSLGSESWEQGHVA